MAQGSISPADRESLRWSARRRLEFIENRLYWEGRINRGDLTQTFEITYQQASNDLTRYLEMAPGNMDYDRSEKYYFATPHFKPVLITPDAEQYLSQLEAWADQPGMKPSALKAVESIVHMVRPPKRSIDPVVVRRFLAAIRSGKALEIEYQSLNRPEAAFRWITPHDLASDGFRWHARAYCHERGEFRDFLLGRVLSVAGEKPHEIDKSRDKDWNRFVTLKVGSHPGLTDAQKRIIERDYAMTDGVLVIEVRAALAFYLLWELRLEEGDMERPARRQQIVLLNREEINRSS